MTSRTPRPPGRGGDLRPGSLMRSGLYALVAAVAAGSCTLGTDDRSEAPLQAEIVIGGRAADENVVPTRVVVRTGGSVIFRTVDHRIHTVEFSRTDIAPDALRFLDDTRQLISPPLLERGTQYTVSFEGAPAGFYPFRVVGPGTEVEGAIVVE